MFVLSSQSLSYSHNGLTPINVAAKCGHILLTKVLLSCRKIDVNLTRANECTPLFTACANRNSEIVEMLIGRQDCDVNKSCYDGVSSCLMKHH